MKNHFFYGLGNAIVLLLIFFFSSCEEIIMEDDITDKEIILVAPVNNSQFFSTSITFSWEEIEGAAKYRLQVAKPNFASPLQIVLDTLITSNNFTHQFNVGTYEWRVKALNGGYETPYKSHFFTVVNNNEFENNSVVLQSPANNFITNQLSQNLSWLPIIGAISYNVQIYNSSNNIIEEQTTSSTSINYTFPEGSYFWRVRASNGLENTLYTSRSILTDRTAPNTPTLVSPVNNTTVSSGDLNFQWNRVAIPGSQERDSIYIYKNNSLTVLHSKNLATSPFSQNLVPGTYFWVVKSFDQAGNIGNRSSIFTFIAD